MVITAKYKLYFLTLRIITNWITVNRMYIALLLNGITYRIQYYLYLMVHIHKLKITELDMSDMY